MYPIHKKPAASCSFDRLDMLWKRYPQYHERTTFSTLKALLEEHESYQKDFDEEIRAEYSNNGYDRFLVNLSWSDLAYRYETRKLIERIEIPERNEYVDVFMEQFSSLDTDRKACFLFPENFISQFFVIMEVCKKAESFHPIRPMFPDEEKVHYLAVFDKKDMDSVLLMYHLLYTNTSEDLYGGYSLYDYSLPWYQTHLWEQGIVLRSPYLPDRIAKYQGGLPFYHNPVKTVHVRRNINHILECGYFSFELEFFLCLTKTIMPFFHWWYEDLMLYEEKDGLRSNWRLERIENPLPSDWGSGWSHVTIAVTCENQWATDRRLPLYLGLPLCHYPVIYYSTNFTFLTASARAKKLSDFMIARPCPSSPSTTS